MRKILKEIHQQPDHIRELFMWTCVVIVVSGIGFVWFRSTQSQVTALLNPQQALQQSETDKRTYAKDDHGQTKSPFQMLGQSWGDLKANISDFMSLQDKAVEQNAQSQAQATVAPQNLPLSK